MILIAAILVASMGLAVAYVTTGTATPSVMGHSWNEIEKPAGCITAADIADGSLSEINCYVKECTARGDWCYCTSPHEFVTQILVPSSSGSEFIRCCAIG